MTLHHPPPLLLYRIVKMSHLQLKHNPKMLSTQQKLQIINEVTIHRRHHHANRTISDGNTNNNNHLHTMMLMVAIMQLVHMTYKIIIIIIKTI